MQCASCDTHNDADARFCRVCGTAFKTSDTPPASRPRYTIGVPKGDHCTVCGKQNPAGARFCVYCAASLHTPATGGTVALRPAFAGAVQTTIIQPTTIVQPGTVAIAQGPNLLVRAIWFVMIGWWLGLIWSIVAWLFNLSLIGLPVGVLMLNAIPQIMTLRPRRNLQVITHGGGTVLVRQVEQPFALRALWFALIGWWASLIWMIIAWLFSASLVLLPIGFWMFDRVPTITTLAAE